MQASRPGLLLENLCFSPKSAFSGYFESLGKNVDQFLLNGGNQSGYAPECITPIVYEL